MAALSNPLKKDKIRLDVLLVERGLCETRSQAQAQIMAGNIIINESNEWKPGTTVDPDCAISIRENSPYVGRGALKIIKALDYFEIDPQGRICIDVGSSTGGFTQVLLERGATRVYAVDSGTNQLHWKLRQDERVVVMENTNARFLKGEDLETRPNLAVMDVSFISVNLLLPMLDELLLRPYQIICLIKPQFELAPNLVSRGGFVKPKHRKLAIEKVNAKAQELGMSISEVIESPIKGAKSANVEYLVYYSRD